MLRVGGVSGELFVYMNPSWPQKLKISEEKTHVTALVVF